jgi:hypothetical protein
VDAFVRVFGLELFETDTQVCVCVEGRRISTAALSAKKDRKRYLIQNTLVLSFKALAYLRDVLFYIFYDAKIYRKFTKCSWTERENYILLDYLQMFQNIIHQETKPLEFDVDLLVILNPLMHHTFGTTKGRPLKADGLAFWEFLQPLTWVVSSR